MQLVVLLLRELPYLVVSGIIVFWYFYQVIAGIVRIVRKLLGGKGGDHGYNVIQSWKCSVRNQTISLSQYLT